MIDVLERPTRIVALAERIIEEGHPFKSGWYDDGTIESGPRGGAVYGVRWGKLIMYVESNSSLVTLTSRAYGLDPWGHDGYPVVFETLQSAELALKLRELAQHLPAEYVEEYA